MVEVRCDQSDQHEGPDQGEFGKQCPAQRAFAVAREFSDEYRGKAAEEEHRNSQRADDVDDVGIDDLNANEHEAAGHLRHEQAEQSKHRTGIDHAGDESEQPCDNPWHWDRFDRHSVTAYRLSQFPIRSTASCISCAEPA